MIRYNKIQKIIEIIKECSAIALKFYAQKNVEVFKKNDNSPVTKADLEISKIATNKLSKIFGLTPRIIMTGPIAKQHPGSIILTVWIHRIFVRVC